MDASARRFVLERANSRCKYCRIPQFAVNLTFHIEHIVAKQHGGSDRPDNLCLACDRCNLRKGPNLTAIDPASGHVVGLFHPRRDGWDDHFLLVGSEIVGRTSVGRATCNLLQVNAARRQELRERLLTENRW